MTPIAICFVIPHSKSLKAQVYIDVAMAKLDPGTAAVSRR